MLHQIALKGLQKSENSKKGRGVPQEVDRKRVQPPAENCFPRLCLKLSHNVNIMQLTGINCRCTEKRLSMLNAPCGMTTCRNQCVEIMNVSGFFFTYTDWKQGRRQRWGRGSLAPSSKKNWSRRGKISKFRGKSELYMLQVVQGTPKYRGNSPEIWPPRRKTLTPSSGKSWRRPWELKISKNIVDAENYPL